jgi:transcriptional regulator CBF1
MAGESAPGKRKRAAADTGARRTSPHLRGTAAAAAAAASAAAAAQEASASMDGYDEHALSQLIAHNNADLQNGGHPSVTETAQAALTHYQVPPSFETGASTGATHGDPNGPFSMDTNFVDQLKEATGQATSHTPQISQSQTQSPVANPKPQVGTEEWHRIRKDNHKEGE